MKILVLGTGKMGCGVVWDLVQNEAVTEVGLVDICTDTLAWVKERAESCACAIPEIKVTLHQADVTKLAEIVPVMQQYDVGVLTLANRYLSYKAIEAAIEAGLDVVDILEEYHRCPDEDEVEGLQVPAGMTIEQYGESLHTRAVERGVLLLDGMGFAPGLSNLTVEEGIRKLDVAEKAVARVGGIPNKEIADEHPLRYVITWAFSHVLREYMIQVNVRRNGELVKVEAATEIERFHFRQFGQDEELVCAITPGMPSFIFTHPELKEFSEKTVRWPGHWSGVQVLKECGLLDLEPVEYQGVSIAPREFLNTILEPRLRREEGEIDDVCVMWNSVEGQRAGQLTRVDYYMWEQTDRENNITAMARVTAFPAAIAAVMIGQGKIAQKGIVAPEEAIVGELYQEFLAELEKRDIHILEIVTPVR